jgi:hypothetical protein
MNIHHGQLSIQRLWRLLPISSPCAFSILVRELAKYGDLIRHAGFDFKPEVTALEIDASCQDTLKEKYDVVDIATAEDLFNRPMQTYEAVIMGGCAGAF